MLQSSPQLHKIIVGITSLEEEDMEVCIKDVSIDSVNY